MRADLRKTSADKSCSCVPGEENSRVQAHIDDNEFSAHIMTDEAEYNVEVRRTITGQRRSGAPLLPEILKRKQRTGEQISAQHCLLLLCWKLFNIDNIEPLFATSYSI